MAVRVKFPDGTMREVESVTRSTNSSENEELAQVVIEPAIDPEWNFQKVIGGWLALPRSTSPRP